MAKSTTSIDWVSVLLLHSALLFVQLGTAGYQIITRIALTGGMNLFVFAVYRGVLGLFFLIPVAIIFERKKRPPLTWPLVGHFFLLGLTGVFLSQAFYLEGLSYTSPTFAAAIQNSIPAITFVIAFAFGQEKVEIKKFHGQAKVVGTLACVAGATVMVFYSGPAIINVDGLQSSTGSENALSSIIFTALKSWQIGAFFLVGMCIAFSFWLVIQNPVVKQYPARLSVTAFTSLFGTLQMMVLALFTVREPSKWALTWGSELISVLYAGIVVSGLVFSVQMWCVQQGGAVLTAVYQPAQTVIVAILTLLFLRENFYLGGLIGGLLIIAGVYTVIWAQGRERQQLDVQLLHSIKVDSSSDQNLNPTAITEPLLNDTIVPEEDITNKYNSVLP